MFEHKLDQKAHFVTYLDWFILAFLAGSINAGGLLACHKFVSHITGFATLAGVSIKDGNFLEALEILTIPIFFLAGVVFAGYLTEKRLVTKLHHQRYSPVMWLVTLFMAVVAIGGSLGWFGIFGQAENIKHDYVLLALLCGACGLQNATITSTSGATVRTTHLTGLTTDLGLGLVRARLHNLPPDQVAREKRSNWLRLGMIFSFFLGSTIGAILFGMFQYRGFFMPAALAGWVALKTKAHHEAYGVHHV